MSARLTTVVTVSLSLLGGPLAAQISIPSISAPKAAAQRAVAATNAHTQAMQTTDAPQSAPQAPAAGQSATPARPAGVVQSYSSATATAKQVAAKPVALTTTTATHGHASALAPAPMGAPLSDSGAKSISITQRGVRGEVSLNREVYSYAAGNRRDPFVSLMQNGDLRPLLTDLRLVTVLYDPTGRNSIAVMHDVGSNTKDQYRVRVGQTLGRMRVAQIEPKEIVFTIEEVGFSRQAALALGDSTTVRTQ
jgi:hypothetical protein